MPISELYLPTPINSSVTCAFFRLKTPHVYFQVKLSDNSARKLDKHRMPLVWLDDKVELDMGDTKSLGELSYRLDPTATPRFSFEDKDVSGVLWHGLVSEGTGFIGKLMKCRTFSIRVYYSDYTSEDYVMHASLLESLKSNVYSNILGMR